MKFGSVCSGIEAASTAWKPLGWKAAWLAEIEPFPSAVLKHHYPDVPNYGDMTKFKEWNAESIDLLCGGTPCQSFSVAGLRKGLDDPRGNLMLTFGAIADHFRPKWLVWENVPGVLSSNSGRDFGAFLWMLGQLGYGFAYRVLDAQYFGVAQRRRRVFVVGCLGDWRSATAVLFERDSLQGNPAPSRETGQEIARCVTAGTGPRYDAETDDLIPAIPINTQIATRHNALGRGTGFGVGDAGDPAYTLIKGHCHAVATTQYGPIAGSMTARHDSSPCADRGMNVVAFHHNAQACQLPTEGRDTSISDALTCSQQAAVAFSAKDHGADATVELSPTLRAMGHSGSHANGGGQVAVAFGVGELPDVGHCLRSGASKADKHESTTYVAVPAIGWSEELTAHVELAGTLQRGGDGGRHEGVMQPDMAVRRLTPVECERLQGFPPGLEIIRIEICTDHQNNSALVEIKCHRLQSSAWNAAESDYMEFAQTVGLSLSTNRANSDPLVALLARIPLEGNCQVLLKNQRGLSLSASNAEKSNWLRNHIPKEDFAALVAPHWANLAKTVTHGKEGPPQSIRLSLMGESGNLNATQSGNAKGETASAAMRDVSVARYITSPLGLVTPTCDLQIAISLCSVIRAISSFTPNEMQTGNFCIDLVAKRDYTNIPWRGKPESPDGPRYKALGNSWAVPCARWIGERIQLVEGIKA